MGKKALYAAIVVILGTAALAAEPVKRVTLIYTANMLGCMTPCG